MDDPDARHGGRPLDSLNRRLWRARGCLSRRKAAPALGVSNKTLQRIENGLCEPTLGQLRVAAELYGVPLNWLLFGDRPLEPALAAFGPDVAALLRQWMRDRFGCDRVEQLDEGQLQEVNAQAKALVRLARSVGNAAMGEE